MHTAMLSARLLLVDDEHSNIELMRRVFARYETHTASNGRIALEMIAQYKYDVVFLDIMMPEMGGLETLEHIRKHYSQVELPVIVVSALTERRGIANGIRMGANDYIIKPFDLDDILVRFQTQVRLKQTADERNRIITAMQAMIDRQDRLMQVASHDLKNPMNNLTMLITLMQKTFADDENTLNLLQTAQHSLRAMNNVIQEFLDISPQANGEMRVRLQPTDGTRIIAEIVNQYAVMAFNKDVRIHARHIEGVIMADANRLSQVISNLLSNAIKYSPLHSEVFIETIVQRNMWQLTISDLGTGVPMAERDQLFQPFSRISTKPTADEHSTGLGLWIVREMMHLQRGEVGAHFPAEGGSQFWIRLPAVEAVRNGSSNT